jgi:hypothetical protein
VAGKNAEFYARYPDDVALVSRIADHLASHEVLLPDGDRLTTQRFRRLGSGFGMSYGYDQLHWLLEEAWQGDRLSDVFLSAVMGQTGHVDGPLFPLQEYIYGQPGSGASAWAAERAIAEHPDFAEDHDPLLFTGEMFYRWMFEEVRALTPFRGAAEELAAYDDWGPLYDLDRLASNEVPVFAAVYFDDMYVDSGLQLETAGYVGNVRAWVTNDLGPLIDEVLLEGDLVSSGFLRLPPLQEMVAQQRSGRSDQSKQLWQLLSMELWYRNARAAGVSAL